jgi:hypothetical protein
MLIRYCATHFRHFGYPRPLGVRWNGWAISSVGGLCEACRERERERWETAPYGQVLVPAPVELGPRTLVRRAVIATIAATAAAVVTAAVLLVAQPPDLIPSGGEPGHFSSGAWPVGSPSPVQASTETERPAASRPSRPVRVVSRAVAPRVAQLNRQVQMVAPAPSGRGCFAPAIVPSAITPAAAARAAPAPVRTARVVAPTIESP